VGWLCGLTVQFRSDRPESWEPISERIAQAIVQDGGTHGQKWLHRPTIPSHLLALGHAFGNDLINRRFHPACRDGLGQEPTDEMESLDGAARTAVLNDSLSDSLRDWFTGFRPVAAKQLDRKAA
jgi:hypothetical protein